MPEGLQLFDRAPLSTPAQADDNPLGLRGYQREAVDAAMADYARGGAGTVIVLPTGSGKTRTACALVRRWLEEHPLERALWLANRDFLLKDARKRLADATGMYVSLEKAEWRASGTRIVAASVQTMKGKRLEAWKPDSFGLIVYDECFPAGTLVDGRPIEDIRVGDLVASIDHASGALAYRAVVRIFRKVTRDLMAVGTDGGRGFICTGNHPVFVKGLGYVEAKALGVGDLLCVRRRLSSAVPGNQQTAEVVRGPRVQVEALIGDHGAHEPRSRGTADASAQPDEERRQPSEDERDLEGDRTRAKGAGRQRPRTDSGGVGSGAGAGLGHARSGTDEGTARLGVPELLQTGRGGCVEQDIDRGGRRKPLRPGPEGAGREEDVVLEWARVDGVSRFQSGSPGGTTVYNLEVEGAHTYFANDVLVHNCHHAASAGSRKIFEHFEKARRLGITATLVRHDKVGAWTVWDSIAYERKIDWAIEEGFFVPIVPIARFIDSIDLSQAKTTAGDLNLGDIEKEIAENAAAIAKLSFEEMGDRPTIIYTPGVASAHAVAATLNQLRAGAARAVDAETPEEERDGILAAFDRLELQFIVNCGIYLEGLDVPNCRGIVIARPTKSEPLYIQMAGRGGRPEGWIGQLVSRDERTGAIAASGKPNFILLDITGHAGRHSLCSAATLAGKASPSEKEEAEKILKENEGMTLGDAIKLAQVREQKRIAAAAAAARVKARRESFNPFARYDIADPGDLSIRPKWMKQPPSDAQLWWLSDQMLPTEGVDVGQFKALRKQADEWKADGRATFRQRQILTPIGLPGDLPFAAAGELVEAVRRCNGRAPAPQVVNAILSRSRVPGQEG